MTPVDDRGAFSVVYKATRKSDGLVVALKVIPRDRLKDGQEGDIIKEAMLLASLKHPNIVRLYDCIQLKDSLVMVTEYMSGGELFHKLVSLGSMSETAARAVMTQVVDALKYLHLERGVVHRDIKLENLLFIAAADGGIRTVKIADFGLVRKLISAYC